MSRIDRALGRRRDIPQLESIGLAGAGAAIAGGTAGDFEYAITFVPELKYGWLGGSDLNFGLASSLPLNRMSARVISFVSSAATTAGAATNNCVYYVNYYRAGVRQGIVAAYPLTVATTLGTATTAGSVQTVTPAAMTGIIPGLGLLVDSGASQELVYVQSVTATTFTAFFAFVHAGAATVTTALPQYRPVNFVLPGGVSTTLPTIGSTGSQAVTPNAPASGLNGMLGIKVGDQLLVDTVASGKQETVTVTAVTNTQFTATFAQTHGANAPVVSTGPQNSPVELREGDTLTLQRVSSGATGIATPVGLVNIEWVPSKILG